MDRMIRRRFRCHIATIIFVASVLACPAWALPREKERWFRLESPNFVLLGNTPESTGKTIASELESLRATLALLKGEKSVLAPNPTVVYLFRGEKSFRPYRPESMPNAQGYFMSGSDGNFSAMYNEGVVSSMEVIFHEYIHYFTRNNMPNLPLWFGEGIAEFYSTFRGDGRQAEIGRMIESHVWLLKQRELMPLADLFAVTTDSKTYNERDHGQGLFYAQCWALVHYLNNGDPALQPKLTDFLIRLLRNEPTGEAFRAAFGIEMAELEKRLRDYIRRDKFGYMRIKMKQAHAEPPLDLQPLSRPDLLFHLGNLVAHLHPAPEARAEEHFRAALALDPEHALSYRGLGYLRLRTGRFDEARALLDKAVALAPGDALTHRYLGRIDLEAFFELTRDRTEPSDEATALLAGADRELTASVELDPALGESHALLGQVLFFREDCDRGLPTLKEALKMMPSRTDVAQQLSMLLSFCGQPDAARYVMEQFVKPVSSREVSRTADEILLLNQVMTLADGCLQDGVCEGVLPRLEEVQGQIRDPQLKEQLQHVMAVIRHNAAVGLYNEAVEAANAGETAKAADLLRRVVDSADDQELQDAAAGLLEQLQRQPG